MRGHYRTISTILVENNYKKEFSVQYLLTTISRQINLLMKSQVILLIESFLEC